MSDKPERVFAATERAGIRRFEPRPFWQLDDYARSGSAADPAKIPPGAVVFRGVYATREAFVPFYYPPRHCPRLSLDPAANAACLPVLGRYELPVSPGTPRVIVFPEPEREGLARFEFSVYAFDSAPFRRLPTGEFLAEVAVEPVRETRHRDAAAAIEAAGWAVGFVRDVGALRALRQDLLAAGVTRFSAEKLGA
jgi:hypothetical protein